MSAELRAPQKPFSPFPLARQARVAATIIVALLAFSHLTPASQRAVSDNNRIERYVWRYDRISMDPAGTEERVRTGGQLSIPTSDGLFELNIVPHDVRAPEYRAEEVTDDDNAHPVTPAALHTYRGTVQGMPDTEVRFCVHPDKLEGVILTPREWYFVEPMRHYDSGAAPSEMAVYRASDIIPDTIGTCGTSLAERVGKAMEMMSPQIMEAGGISVADVATEADYEYVTALGGSASANSAILGILNQVDGIYQSQLSLSLRVVYQHSWSTSSEPYSSSTPSSLLDQFRSHWEANFGSVNYDLAHMWTGRDLEGSVVGIAYLGVVCNARSYSYGISQNLNSAPAKYILTAHEIGHNFGATHTEQANPPQPNCSNTIMNSSVGTGTTFCQFSKNEVATHVSQHSSCLATTTTGNCDLNRDGQINASDIQLLVNVILAMSPCPGNCDVNKDGQVNVADLQRLANVVLGISGCP